MQRGIFILRRTGRVIVVFFLVFFCVAGLWLFQSFRESRVVKTKKEYRNVYITDVKQQKVEGIWRGQKKTWQLRSAVSKEKISGVADFIRYPAYSIIQACLNIPLR